MPGPGTGSRPGGVETLAYTAKGIFSNWKIFEQSIWY